MANRRFERRLIFEIPKWFFQHCEPANELSPTFFVLIQNKKSVFEILEKNFNAPEKNFACFSGVILFCSNEPSGGL